MKNKSIIFLLTRQQWLGLAILVLLAGVTLFCLHRFQPAEGSDLPVSDSTLTAFTQHLSQQDSLRKAQRKKPYSRDTIAIHLQAFDPNTADSSTLVHLGLRPWQASNMLKYRAKNGRYRQAEDLKKLYGMTDSLYQTLLPYIQIDTLAVRQFRDSLYRAQRPRVSPNRADSDTLARDTTPRYLSNKRDTVLNLRTADTTELKMIRGIGAYRAKQIVRYREQLGGFASVEQLCEVKALQPLFSDSLSADSLLRHFVLDSVKVAPLRVNSARVETLQRHPYISFEQAKAIYELRRRKIRLKNIEQLRTLDCLTEADLRRLQPYLHFE
jgi:competence ComEA-like helix-hairpin-helix protein